MTEELREGEKANKEERKRSNIRERERERET